MGAILSSLRNTVIAGIILTVIVAYFVALSTDTAFYLRYMHILVGVMWIGLLWYFNFVQIPTMPSIPDDLKPAIGKHIAPEALFWFRHAAWLTIATGLALAMVSGYVHDAMMLAEGKRLIGIGMYFGIIMAFNVWFMIWPAQKIALGLVEADAADKPAAARKAMLFSRTNTLLSIPMLYCMVGNMHL